MNCCTYLLPIRRSVFSDAEAQEFIEYFGTLRANGCEVIIVDGSSPDVFAQHRALWSAVARHESVDKRFGYLNDKVNGIHTGVELASCEKIILADDDIRYTPNDIGKMVALLEQSEMVRPQNYLSSAALEPAALEPAALEPAALEPARPRAGVYETDAAERSGPRAGRLQLPWWARMESARMLINRATLKIGDYPGACAFRRSTMLRLGHYDGDVLFDNEELIRHFARFGASIHYAIDFFVQKRPPTLQKWKEQRPRQAYEDFGLRAKTALFLSLPVLIIGSAIVAGTPGFMLCLVLISIFATALACAGGARGEAGEYIPGWICLYAPLWVFERSFSTYWAIYWYFRHGGYPFGDKLLTKGIGRDWVEGGRVAADAAAQQPK